MTKDHPWTARPLVLHLIDSFLSSYLRQVLKLVQIIAQARQTAKRISDHSAEVAANNSFLSWFSMGSSELNTMRSRGEVDDMGECVKKTHEFLDKALDSLCQIFRVSPYLFVVVLYFLQNMDRN